MKKILTVVGTRPEIIKMFPLIKELDKKFNQKIIFSGQHFSENMASIFFKDLKLRQPNININIKDRNNFYNEFYTKLRLIIRKENPEAIIYHGDTFTTLASAMVSHLNYPEIKNIHIESGYRSNDRSSIEEKIRKIVDNISYANFTIRKAERNNLYKEGLKKNVYEVGNTIYDSIQIIKKRVRKNNKKKYIYVTIHRVENVDNKKRLGQIFNFLNIISKKINIVISLHPRTKKMKNKYKLRFNKNIKVINTMNYSDNISYLDNSHFCITDSGGLQEESIILGKKCFIPLQSTPHKYYLGKNSNELIDIKNIKKILSYINQEIKIKKFDHKKNVTKNICRILKKII